MPTRPHRGLDEQRRARSPGPGPGRVAQPAPAPAASPVRRAVPTAPGSAAGVARRRRGARRRPRRPPRAGRGTGRARAASRPRGPCWTTRPPSSTATCSARSVVESRWATRMPVRPASSRSAARTTWASVTGSMRAVASSSTTTRTSRTSSRAKATSCSSPADRRGAARARAACRARRAARRPRPSRPSSATARSTVGARDRRKSVMFSARVPARISVRWVTTPTADAQPLQVEVEHVDAAEEHRAALGLDRAGEQRGQRRLARAGAADQGARSWPAGTCRSTCCRAKRALGVGEVQVAELHVERARRAASSPPTGSRLGAEQPAQPEHRAEAGLQVGQVPGQLVDLADEHRGDQEQRHQRGGRRGGRRRPARRRRRAVAASTPCSSMPVRRPIRLSSRATAANRSCTAAASSVQRRTTWAWPRLARRSSRAGDALLHRGGVVGPGHLLLDLAGRRSRASSGRTTASAADPGEREQDERRPPGDARRRSTAARTRAACGSPARRSAAAASPTSWVSSSTRSSTSPTACSVSAASGWCSAASSRSARSRPSARSTTPAHSVRADGVEHGRRRRRRRRAARPASCVACSASRPATSEPREVPTAATAHASSAQTATGTAQPPPVDGAVGAGRDLRRPGGGDGPGSGERHRSDPRAWQPPPSPGFFRRVGACPGTLDASYRLGLGHLAAGDAVDVEDAVDLADGLDDVVEVTGVAHLEGEPGDRDAVARGRARSPTGC